MNNKGITFESEEELLTLAELVFLGERVINGCRLHKNIISKYDDMMNRICDAHAEVCEEEEKTIGYEGNDKLNGYLKYYDESVCINTLADMLELRHSSRKNTCRHALLSKFDLSELRGGGFDLVVTENCK